MDRNLLHFRIAAMNCVEEVAVLRKAVGPIVGGEDRLSFDVLAGRMSVDVGDGGVQSGEIKAAVAKTGMQAVPWSEADRPTAQSPFPAWSRSVVGTVLSGASLSLGIAVHLAGVWWRLDLFAVEIVARALLGLAILTGLWLVAPKAFRAAIGLRPDMNLLMTVAVVGAVIIGQYVEAATVAFLFALSNSLEAWSIRRAHRAITSLLDLTPPTARVLTAEGEEDTRPIKEVPVSSRIAVRPGERIPLDGVITSGASQVNQAPITGESLPIEKQNGDTVFAGTVNGNGALEIETTRAADDTTVAHIVRMIDEARSRRSPSEQWVDRFARVYTPTVMALALVVFLVPPLALGQSWSDWFYRSLVLLVIACPCALVISTPVSVVAAIAAAARQGVLVKGGVYMEAPSHLRAIAFDKTGTLTEGRPSVQAVMPLDKHTERELLERAAALEARSEHPLAMAIVEHARGQGIDVRPAEDYQAIPGQGATGRWNGQSYWLGSARLLEARSQATPTIQERIAQLSANGQTVVIVGNQQHVCGLLALADTVRNSSQAALADLKALGVRHVEVLTGDTQSTAQAIGRKLGIDEIRAELLPAEKVLAVEDLVHRFGSAAMIGDGINDAPALATATLGIAMGVAGSDAAIETADVALMSNDLTKLPWLIRLSRRTLRIIRQNICFSLAVKGVFVALTFLGFATLWGAIAADMGASLLVIFNGLRLLNEGRTKPPTF